MWWKLPGRVVLRRDQIGLAYAARSTGIGSASGCASVSQPSTFRMVIWPDASRAQNSMAAVSADGSTVWVLIRRLNSSCSRSAASASARAFRSSSILRLLKPMEAIRAHAGRVRQATLYVVGHVRAVHLQADLGGDRQAVPTHVGPAGAEHAGPL